MVGMYIYFFLLQVIGLSWGGVTAPSATTIAAGDAFSPLIGQLTDLRFEVEALNGEIERLKDENQKKLNALAIQHNEVAANLHREELRATQLQQKFAIFRLDQSSLSQVDQQLLPILNSSLADLSGYLQHSLPFHPSERLAQVKSLQEQLAVQSLKPHQGALKLWSFIEDEFRLTRENAISRQVITVEGHEIIAQVVHLGMVAMFFQTPNGMVGTAGPGPVYQQLVDRKSVNAINDLFGGIKKQMRSGSYWLPNIFTVPSSI